MQGLLINPSKTDNSINPSDIDLQNSMVIGWDGDINTLFKYPFSGVFENTLIDNPKTFTLAFTKPLYFSNIVLIDGTNVGFSNFKITANKDNPVVLVDDVNKDEVRYFVNLQLGDNVVTDVTFEFYTANAVALTAISIQKNQSVVVGNSLRNAIPISADSVYVCDLDQETCSSAGFDGGNIADLISYSKRILVNDSNVNPKRLIIDLIRPIQTNILGIAASQGDFSNVKISIGFGDVPGATVVFDESANNTKKSILIPDLPPLTFSTLIIEFFTSDTVSVNSVGISKLSRTVATLQAQKPNGTIANINANINGNLLVSLDEQKDAFGRLKVAEPATIFDSSLTSSFADALFWSTLINGGGTSVYSSDNSHMLMSVVSNGDYVVRQTKQRFKYQPAKSHEFFITGLFNAQAGVRKRAGLVDYDNKGLSTITNAPQNGVFFENNSGVLSWNIVKNGVIIETATQENWNIDKLDGTGKTAFTLNINAVNILACQLEWLGVGVVLVGFATGGGSVAYCHAFQHASQAEFTDTYMRTANLPVAYAIASTGGAGSMKQICSSVISGGGFNPLGKTNAAQNVSPVSISSGLTQLVLGIRLKEDSFEYTIDPKMLSILTTSNGNALWVLSINPTYSGTVTWTDLLNSEVQQAVGNGNVVSSEGIVLAKGSFSNNADSINQEIDSSVKLGKSLSGNIDEMWLIVKALGNDSYYGTINFKELI